MHLVTAGLQRYGVASLRRHGIARIGFAVLLAVQVLHLGEHTIQMIQLYVLHLPSPQARGLISPLDIEKVHFFWNLAVLGAVAWLLTTPLRTPWLVAMTVWAVLHTAEHGFLLARALASGLEGQPGVLGAGGWLAQHGWHVAGVTTWSRPTVHFAWNLGEVVLLAIAFVAAVRPRLPGLPRLAFGHPFLVAALVLLAAASSGRAADIRPQRVIADRDPNFTTLWVDTENDEIVVGNDAQETLQVYSRKANGLVAPLREIKGRKTLVTFPGQVFVDPKHDEIWSVGNDIADSITVYRRTDDGDVPPIRTLSFKPHRLNRTWGFFVDTVNDEVAVTHQRRNRITVWARTAATGAAPIRSIQGPATRLANPHGIFIDPASNEIYVVNQGHRPGSIAPPSITVYARNASGDAAPLRTIQGPSTQLDDARPIFVDAARREIVVATGSPSDAVVYFRQSATANAAPVRMIKGDQTGLNNPSGVFVDTVNNEVLVANWGNHTITVYPRDASGNVRPLRVISPTRSRVAVGISNPGAIAFDPDRDEIWATN